jgi:hypothetical protein
LLRRRYKAASKNRPAGHAVAVSDAFRALVCPKHKTSAIVRDEKG